MGLGATAFSQGLGEVTGHPQTLSHLSPGLNVLYCLSSHILRMW